MASAVVACVDAKAWALNEIKEISIKNLFIATPGLKVIISRLHGLKLNII